MTQPRYTDYWARVGRRYVPAASTDIRETFRRAREQQATQSNTRKA